MRKGSVIIRSVSMQETVQRFAKRLHEPVTFLMKPLGETLNFLL